MPGQRWLHQVHQIQLPPLLQPSDRIPDLKGLVVLQVAGQAQSLQVAWIIVAGGVLSSARTVWALQHERSFSSNPSSNPPGQS